MVCCSVLHRGNIALLLNFTLLSDAIVISPANSK